MRNVLIFMIAMMLALSGCTTVQEWWSDKRADIGERVADRWCDLSDERQEAVITDWEMSPEAVDWLNAQCEVEP